MVTALILFTAIYQPKWTQTFAQEFDGKAGTAPDRKIWSRDTGGGGFGNNELETYTDGNKNAFLDGQGNLVIEARKERVTGDDNITRDYTSARLKTNASFTQAYGKIEARMKMPVGKGIWPAFWMLGADIGKAGWPKCGELDIMEFLGHEPKITHGTIHGPGYSGGAGVSSSTISPTNLNDGFHVYGIEWEPEAIRFYLDGKLFQTTTPNDIGTNDWVYDHPFFIILNLAVGGGWPGNPDANTTFPQRLIVDYIRAYKDENLVIDTEGIRQRAEYRKAHGPTYNWPGPFAIPGMIPAADYNLGGAEVAYHDTTPQNEGGQGRIKEGVDVGFSGSPISKFSIGWTKAGEWLKYDLVVEETASYSADIQVASEGEGGSLHLEVDGKMIGDSVSVPNTGGWSNWQKVTAGSTRMTKGKHTLKVMMDRESTKTGSIGNIMSLRFTKL
jgi:beta-glucanase (GH16 family)